MESGSGGAMIRDRLLPAATVRIYVDDQRTGSGFFVAPGGVVTCRHVLKRRDGEPTTDARRIRVEGLDHESFTVKEVRHVSPLEEEDLAVLRVEPGEHDCVLLQPGLNPGDTVQAFGFTALHDEGIPVTLENEGRSGDERLFKLKGGQVERGMSGSPLLNARTGAVCGILRRTIDPDQSLGGYAIPLGFLYDMSNAIATDNRAFHTTHREWVDCLPSPARETWLAEETAEPLTARAEVVLLISVEQQSDCWEVSAEFLRPSGQVIGPERVDLNPVRLDVARLFRDWASPELTWRGRISRGEEMRLLGKVLVSAVFPGEVRQAVERLLEQKRDSWVQVGVRFLQADQDLEYLPWEYAYFPLTASRGECYLARRRRFAFTRVCGDKLDADPPASNRMPSILIVSALPPGQAATDSELALVIKSVVREAEDVLRDQGAFSVSVAEPQSLGSLLAEVTTKRPDIVHYVGYGCFVNGCDEVALGSLAGEPSYIDPAAFATALEDATPRLVVMEQLATPMLPGVRPDLGLFAREILARGVDALVAFQYAAQETVTSRFNKSFYSRLATGAAVELAVQDARFDLYPGRAEERDWVVPTVTTRGLGGVKICPDHAISSLRSYVGAAPAYG